MSNDFRDPPSVKRAVSEPDAALTSRDRKVGCLIGLRARRSAHQGSSEIAARRSVGPSRARRAPRRPHGAPRVSVPWVPRRRGPSSRDIHSRGDAAAEACRACRLAHGAAQVSVSWMYSPCAIARPLQRPLRPVLAGQEADSAERAGRQAGRYTCGAAEDVPEEHAGTRRLTLGAARTTQSAWQDEFTLRHARCSGTGPHDH